MTTETITVLANNYMTAADVYAKANGYPSEEGDGIYVGTITLTPYAANGSITWTLPTSATYYYGSVAIYQGVAGQFNRLELP